MKPWFIRFRLKFEAVNRAVTHRASIILFSAIYIIIVPWFALLARGKETRLKSWYPWKLKSDTLEELRKQY